MSFLLGSDRGDVALNWLDWKQREREPQQNKQKGLPSSYKGREPEARSTVVFFSVHLGSLSHSLTPIEFIFALNNSAPFPLSWAVFGEMKTNCLDLEKHMGSSLRWRLCRLWTPSSSIGKKQGQVHFFPNRISCKMPHPIVANWCESLWFLQRLLQQRSAGRATDTRQGVQQLVVQAALTIAGKM